MQLFTTVSWKQNELPKSYNKIHKKRKERNFGNKNEELLTEVKRLKYENKILREI
jgi:hypothetical protein